MAVTVSWSGFTVQMRAVALSTTIVLACVGPSVVVCCVARRGKRPGECGSRYIRSVLG